MDLKPDSNDPTECLLSFESPYSVFNSLIVIYNNLNLVKVLVRVSKKWQYIYCTYPMHCTMYEVSSS